jgi:hypothetical protein
MPRASRDTINAEKQKKAKKKKKENGPTKDIRDSK